MKPKVQPCPACGNKHPVRDEILDDILVCENPDCFMECLENDWNRLSLAVQAADARWEVDHLRGLKNAWPNRLPEELAYAAIKRQEKMKPMETYYTKEHQK
jgi:hypothetical protein